MSHGKEQGRQSADSIERQRADLLVLQAGQMAALEASGTAEVGRQIQREKSMYFDVENGAAPNESHPQELPADTRATVAKSRGKLYMVFAHTNEYYQPVSHYIVVGESQADALVPTGRFTNDDVIVVWEQLQTIERAKKEGKFPDIAEDLSSIVDPGQDSAFS